jgi:hypothetical protein
MQVYFKNDTTDTWTPPIKAAPMCDAFSLQDMCSEPCVVHR